MAATDTRVRCSIEGLLVILVDNIEVLEHTPANSFPHPPCTCILRFSPSPLTPLPIPSSFLLPLPISFSLRPTYPFPSFSPPSLCLSRPFLAFLSFFPPLSSVLSPSCDSSPPLPITPSFHPFPAVPFLFLVFNISKVATPLDKYDCREMVVLAMYLQMWIISV